MSVKKGNVLTVKDALDKISQDTAEEKDHNNSIETIFITPPEPSVLTDEDSADEDVGELYGLSGNQLRAEAEVVRNIQEDEQDVPDRKNRKWVRSQLDYIIILIIDYFAVRFSPSYITNILRKIWCPSERSGTPS